MGPDAACERRPAVRLGRLGRLRPARPLRGHPLRRAAPPDGRTLLFSSGLMQGDAAKVTLFASTRTADGWAARKPAGVGCGDFVNGVGFDPADGARVFYSAACPGGQGRMDIRETRLP